MSTRFRAGVNAKKPSQFVFQRSSDLRIPSAYVLSIHVATVSEGTVAARWPSCKRLLPGPQSCPQLCALRNISRLVPHLAANSREHVFHRSRFGQLQQLHQRYQPFRMSSKGSGQGFFVRSHCQHLVAAIGIHTVRIAPSEPRNLKVIVSAAALPAPVEVHCNTVQRVQRMQRFQLASRASWAVHAGREVSHANAGTRRF